MVKRWIAANPNPRPKPAISLPLLDKAIRFYRLTESFLRRYIGLAPTAWEWANRAGVALKNEELETAIECATLAIARDRFLADGYYVRAEAIFRQGDPAKAIDDWNQVVRLLPNWAMGWNERGVANLELGRTELALADFNCAVSRDHRNADMLSNRAFAHFASGNQAQAAADWDAALKIAPDCINVYRSRAYSFLGTGQVDAGLADCERLLEIAPTAADGYHMRGEIFFHTKDYCKAIADLTRAIELDGSKASVWRTRGHCCFLLGQTQRAIDDTSACLKIAPNDAIALNNRGLFRTKMGEYSLAVADLARAMEVLPSLPNSYKNLAWIQATCPDAAFRDGKQAVANALRAWEMNKGEQVAWLEIIAAAHAEAADFDEAIAIQRKYLVAAKVEGKTAAELRLAHYERKQPFRDIPSPCQETT